MAKCNQWTAFLLTAISAARIGMGLFVGIRGPTMLYLARNVGSTVSAVSYIFVFRSIGVVLGAVGSGLTKRWMKPSFRHMYPLGFVVVLFGLCSLTMPPIRSIALLFLNITAGNLMYGYLDAGLQALLLYLFGEKESRPFIQLFHFTFSIGAFLGPILANPFLVLDDKAENTKEKCPTGSFEPTSKLSSNFSLNFTLEDDHSVRQDVVQWVFYIIGLWIVGVGCLILVLAKIDIEGKIPRAVGNGSRSGETRLEEPVKDVIGILSIIVAFYVTNVSTESVFYYYLYPVVICSGLSLSVSSASFLNSVMWLGLGIGRLVATIAISFVTPGTIIVFGIIGSVIDGLLMTIWGETTAWIIWLTAFSHLFTTGIFYPSGVSWASKVTNVSGTYQFIFAFGSAIGGATMLPLAGSLFDINPFNVIYVVFALAVINGVVFGVAVWLSRRHLAMNNRKIRSISGKELDKYEKTLRE